MSAPSPVNISASPESGGKVLQRLPTPSIAKTFYLVVFIGTMYQSISDVVFPYLEEIWARPQNSDKQRPLGSYDWLTPDGLLVFVVLLAGLVFFLHMLRLYKTVEELEDPFSRLHKDFVCKLNGGWKRVEQVVRLLLFVIVSAKVLSWLPNLLASLDISRVEEGKPTKLAVFVIFSVLLYFVMLLWDVTVWAATRKNGASRIRWEDTYAASSAGGFAISLCFSGLYLFGSPADPSTEKLLWLLAGAYVLYIGIALLAKGGFGQILDVLGSLSTDVLSPFRMPYCGDCPQSVQSNCGAISIHDGNVWRTVFGRLRRWGAYLVARGRSPSGPRDV